MQQGYRVLSERHPHQAKMTQMPNTVDQSALLHFALLVLILGVAATVCLTAAITPATLPAYCVCRSFYQQSLVRV